MMAGRRVIRSQAGPLLAGMACLMLLAGCNMRPNAPESRAEYFVEKMLLETQTDELRSLTTLAPDQGLDALITDIPTRTAMTYLRNRQRLGAQFGFHVAGQARVADDRKTVSVAVTEGITVGAAETVILRVDLVHLDDEWRVARLRAD